MYRTGFVPQQYVVDAIYESRFKREQSAHRNYQRNVYESIENNDNRFDNMLHSEMNILKRGEENDENRKIKQFNRYEY